MQVVRRARRYKELRAQAIHRRQTIQPTGEGDSSPYSLQCLRGGATREGGRHKRDKEEQRGEGNDCDILTWPRDTETFPNPEHPKCRQHDADGELECVFRDSRERTMDGEPNARKEYAGR